MRWDNYISVMIGIFGSIANYLWGGIDLALQTLLLFMTLDYITGVMSAYKAKNLSSSIGFDGILKKVMILIVVAVAFNLDVIVNTNGLVRSMVIFFYISMEGISILENAAILEVGIPKELKERLLQLRDKKDEQ